MGVDIYPCRLKERVADVCHGDEYNELLEKHEEADEDIVAVENPTQYDNFIDPFESGIYTYETGKSWVQMSYSGYADFLLALERIAHRGRRKTSFDVTESASSIDGCVSYKTAESMLNEFNANKEKADKYFHRKDADDYDEFLWGCYENYTKVLEECIEMKGIVRYH